MGDVSQLTNKSKTEYWMKRKGTQKFKDTKYEKGFSAFAKSRGWTIEEGTPIAVDDGWALTPDFQMKLGNLVEIVILIDGMKVHRWKTVGDKLQGAGKDSWRDEQYVKHGKKPIHIGGELCIEKHWDYLTPRFFEAVVSKESFVYIAQ